MRAKRLTALAAGTLFLAAVVAPALAEAAEHSVTATIQGTAKTTSAAGSGARGRASRSGATAATGQTATFSFDMSTSEQTSALKAATTMQQFLDTLNGFKVGSMTVTGEGSVPINAAYKEGNSYVLLFASALKWAEGSGGRGAAGRSAGMASLNVGTTEGWIANTTQVVGWSGDTPVARAGGSSATYLTDVKE